MSQGGSLFDFDVSALGDNVFNFEIGLDSDLKRAKGLQEDEESVSTERTQSVTRTRRIQSSPEGKGKNQSSLSLFSMGGNVNKNKLRDTHRSGNGRLKKEPRKKRKKEGSTFSLLKGSLLRRGLSNSRRLSDDEFSLSSRRTWLEHEKQQSLRRSRYLTDVSDRLHKLSNSLFERLSMLKVFLGEVEKQNLGDSLLTELTLISREIQSWKTSNIKVSREAFIFICLKCYGVKIDLSCSAQRHNFITLWHLLATKESDSKMNLKDFEAFAMFLWETSAEFKPIFNNLKTRHRGEDEKVRRKTSIFDEGQLKQFVQNSLRKVGSLRGSRLLRISNRRNRRRSRLSSFEEESVSAGVFSPSDNLCKVAFRLFEFRHEGQMTKSSFEVFARTFLSSSLGNFLRDIPGGKKSLMTFLNKELNTELLNFYYWVKDKQREYSPTGEGYDFHIPIEIAQQVLNHHIYPDAEESINVSGAARTNAVETIESAIVSGAHSVSFAFARSLFVQNFQLMENDAFCRYRSSLGKPVTTLNREEEIFLLADEVWSNLRICKPTISLKKFTQWVKGTNTLLQPLEDIANMTCDIVSMI